MAIYFFILAFQLVGIASYVFQIVIELDKKSPDDSTGEVFKLFWKMDRFTVLFSIIILAFNELIHFAIEFFAPEFIASIEYYNLISCGIALILGYGGQALFLKLLGKSRDFVEKKALDKLQ